MIYLFCVGFFLVGVYGLLVKRNIIKMIISVVIMNYALHVFLILLGYKTRAGAPVVNAGSNLTEIVDPLPQAMVMLSFFISISITAVLVAIALRIHEKFRTFDLAEIKRINKIK